MSELDLSLYGDDHIRRYQETDGAVGHDWNGAPTLVLTTTGRRSGVDRSSAMIYAQDGDRCIVIASQGGAPTHPNWYHNLVAQPAVTVQVRGDRFRALARTAEGEERTRLWALANTVWPRFDDYQTRTDRVIPVVVLEPVA
jgi:deazaflavin-dependent oxidoreductase (nitroreductase family)